MSRPVKLALLLAAAFPAVHCLVAQSSAAKSTRSAAELSDDELASAVATSLGPTGIVPVQRGYNASLISSSQHDSISGWSSVLTPSVAYRFNRVFSADVSTPVFLYIHTQSTVALTSYAGGPPTGFTTVSQSQHGIVADTVLAAHAHLPPFLHHRAYDTLTALLIAPTGSVSDGVGAGKASFNVTNHIESANTWSPYLDLGIGTSSRVQNRRLQRDQTSRGTLANFAIGARIQLPRHADVALEAYEQLPLGSQTVTATQVRQGGPRETTPQSTTSGVAEDNGFNTALDIPLAEHLTLSSFYSRSLRQHEDIAGFSLTFLLKTTRTR